MLDAVSLEMLNGVVSGRHVLCFGYPEVAGSGSGLENLWQMGATGIDIVDIIKHKGMERIVDLNEPCEWPQRYGVVINPGTAEHCFNVAAAIKNAWDATLPGGFALHVAPASMLNHGFWNMNPIVFQRWCDYNGGAVRALRFAENGTGRTVAPEAIKGSSSGRGKLPPETVLYALCEKLHDVPSKWPAQSQYAR